MGRVRIEGNAPDAREYFGKLLRRAFPLRLQSFEGLPDLFRQSPEYGQRAH